MIFARQRQRNGFLFILCYRFEAMSRKSIFFNNKAITFSASKHGHLHTFLFQNQSVVRVIEFAKFHNLIRVGKYIRIYFNLYRQNTQTFVKIVFTRSIDEITNYNT